MKTFCAKLLLLLPLPLLVIGYNWFIDPVHLRDAEQYEYGIAHHILNGQRVTKLGRGCGQCHANPAGGGKLKGFGEKFKANGNKVK